MWKGIEHENTPRMGGFHAQHVWKGVGGFCAWHVQIGIVTGNPRVSQRNPYPYPQKPVPAPTGTVRVRVYPWVSDLITLRNII